MPAVSKVQDDARRKVAAGNGYLHTQRGLLEFAVAPAAKSRIIVAGINCIPNTNTRKSCPLCPLNHAPIFLPLQHSPHVPFKREKLHVHFVDSAQNLLLDTLHQHTQGLVYFLSAEP